jgi:hypothetical protein
MSSVVVDRRAGRRVRVGLLCWGSESCRVEGAINYGNCVVRGSDLSWLISLTIIITKPDYDRAGWFEAT